MSQNASNDHMALSEDYVRNFFTYADPDNEAMLQLYRIGVFRTAKALSAGWIMPDEDARTARNLEYLRDNFEPGDVSVGELVSSETQLASFPDIYFRIRKVLDSPNSPADDISREISNDLGLTAKLLKLVNSPFYGLAHTVEDVSHAIAIVGVEEVSTLALGISAINVFKDIPQELIDMKAFWKHSVSCGVFAKLIASRIEGMKADKFFTAGLLHDVGRLIIFKKMPYASVQLLLYARENQLPVVESEEDHLGFDHTQVAKQLLTEWKFPASMVDCLAFHHAPSQAQDQLAASILQLADNMANAMEISSGGMYLLPGMEEGAWERIPLQGDDLVEIVGLFDSHIEELFKAIL